MKFYGLFQLSKYFKKWNLILGWAVFLNALVTYMLTVEPTVSYWDCGEYIATSAKLEVAHPPGAPLFQILGAFFSLLATSKEQVALWVNHLSCVSSAFAILFLFWTITLLLQKIVCKKKEFGFNESAAILVSGLIGALTFTYSDSFWFNATETEVYSMASLLMALLLWMGLKWGDALGKPMGNKWLLLICFVVGLTFGVQFMGFLAIPSIVLGYFFNRWKKWNAKRFLLAHVLAVGLLMLTFKYALTSVLWFFGWSEVFLVNTFGLPFNSGSLLAGIVIVTLLALLVWYTHKKKMPRLNILVLALVFLFLGFSSWLMLPIRASVNVNINENNPEDARTLLAYYNREQYPQVESPFYGAYYSERFAPSGEPADDHPKYEKDVETGKYVIVNPYKNTTSKPNKKHVGWLPRMWSADNAENYMRYFGALNFTIKPEYRSQPDLQNALQQFRASYENGEIDAEGYVGFLKDYGAYIDVQPPTLWQNIHYMLSYQFDYMCLRYFMWNFVGKNNDEQGRYDGNGEWLSGVSFLDAPRLGSQTNLPDDVKKNKGRNTYYFLPFLLGLLGMFYHARKDLNGFWVFFVFFLFTGVAIQFYTNPPIFQPRERDYSLVGAFYAFSMWIGFGAYAVFEIFKRHGKRAGKLVLLPLLVLFTVPLLMAFQNWDDHDRSHRYTARASARAYLDSTKVDSGAILFTIGDNDNFPLWYVQEVEEYRTDTRVIVTGYFATDWYIDQMKRQAYGSAPIPSQLTHEQYAYGTRDYLLYQPLTDNRWDIKDFMDWIASDHPRTQIRYLLKKNGIDTSEYSESYLSMVYYPTNKIRVPVNKKNVLKTGLVKPEDADLIVDYIDIDLPENGLYKNRMMMLDILANNDWMRPIHFSGGSFDDAEYLWMKDYLQLDGLTYKLVPIKTAVGDSFELGRVDSDLMYRIVKKWDWGNSGSSEIYHDPQTRKQFGVSFRLSLARLVETLLEEQQFKKAHEVIDMAMENIPLEHYGYYAFVEPFFEGYYRVGEPKKAKILYKQLKTVYQQQLAHYIQMPLWQQQREVEKLSSSIYGYRRILQLFSTYGDKVRAEEEWTTFEAYLQQLPQYLFGN